MSIYSNLMVRVIHTLLHISYTYVFVPYYIHTWLNVTIHFSFAHFWFSSILDKIHVTCINHIQRCDMLIITYRSAKNIYMTRNQIILTKQSGRVPKILTASKILQISIALCQIKAKIHSFPTMYIIGGGKFGLTR